MTKKLNPSVELLKLLAQSDTIADAMSNKLDEELVKLLVPGAYYLRPNPVNKKLAIFGKIVSPTDPEDKKSLQRNPNLRLVNAYSVGCVEGELGTEYICNMIPISIELFEYAQFNKWNISSKDAFQFVLLLAQAEKGNIPKGSA